MSDDILEWAKRRACEQVNGESGFCSWTPQMFSHDEITPGRTIMKAFARYIAKHEQPPVDPLLVMAREAVASRHFRDAAAAIRAGEFDDGSHVQTALTALRMAQEQGLPE